MERYEDEYIRRWGRPDAGGSRRAQLQHPADGERYRGSRTAPGQTDGPREAEPSRGFGRYDAEAGYRGSGYDGEFRRSRRWW